MANIHRLKDLTIRRAKERGRLSDGGGLYVQISKWGTKSWEFRFTLHGKTRTMGLGAYEIVSLAEARGLADDLRKVVRQGVDPLEARNAAKLKAQVDAAKAIKFKDAVEECLAKKEGEFRSERHGKNWRRSVDAYAVPIIGDRNIADITTQDVLLVLNQPFEDGTLWEKEPKRRRVYALG